MTTKKTQKIDKTPKKLTKVSAKSKKTKPKKVSIKKVDERIDKRDEQINRYSSVSRNVIKRKSVVGRLCDMIVEPLMGHMIQSNM